MQVRPHFAQEYVRDGSVPSLVLVGSVMAATLSLFLQVSPETYMMYVSAPPSVAANCGRWQSGARL